MPALAHGRTPKLSLPFWVFRFRCIDRVRSISSKLGSRGLDRCLPDSPGFAGFHWLLKTLTTKNAKSTENLIKRSSRSLCPLRFPSPGVAFGEVARSSFRLMPALVWGGSGLFPRWPMRFQVVLLSLCPKDANRKGHKERRDFSKKPSCPSCALWLNVPRLGG